MDGLTNDQSGEYHKYKKIEVYFENDILKVNSYPPLDDEFTEFKANVLSLEQTVPRKTADYSGITDSKDELKTDVGDFWGPICSVGRAYALKVGNLALATDLKHSASEISNLKDGDVQPLCLHVRDLLTPLLLNPVFIPYGITALMLTTGMTLANDFQNMIGKPDEANADKTAASALIEEQLVTLRANNEQFTLLIDHFAATDDDFVNGYIAVNVIDDVGIHHSGLEGFVKNKVGGSPIGDALIRNIQLDREEKSDLLGAYQMIKMVPALYEIEVSAAGKKTQMQVIKILKGKIIDLDWEMEDA